jgi:hypothetical protein
MKNIILLIFLLGLIGCSDSDYYKVEFENVDKLMPGDKVLIKGFEVGRVNDLKLKEDYSGVIVTISVRQNIKLKKGSTFTLHSDLLGTKHIAIDSADSGQLLNSDDIQKGYIQPIDLVGGRKISKQEYDSLVKFDPNFKLADSLFMILGVVKENLDKKKKND